MKDSILISLKNGFFASLILLTIYVVIVSLVSGWGLMLSQLTSFWYYIVSLAIGFGIQFGLYSYLRKAMQHMHSSRNVLAVSGTTSTAAMVSCCAHYLTNLIPLLGTAGIITILSQYQIQFFLIGIMFNFAGIAFMLNRVIKFSKKL